MTPHEQDMRLEALRLAVAAGAPELRQDFYDFLTRKSDQTPPQIIDAALEAANVT